ncbi:phospholipase D-like domain-containing protein [Plebeiibacterium sediminum]|uniref:Phospholipase D family protein n=1 Tax=Plebeiibacterium sediminum TaxID=2992112 RepID=A0AAE3M996_9BACT|nr:phospholipase D-like domain-containing protein [Plebeiobacterium sediminum]MCW3789282.1 phospholipase D family protein [Plebeiobacterium sediminum]
MKLYQKFKQIVEQIKPIQTAWFTTFNMDPELVEKFLVSAFVGKGPEELKTAEDYEALNLELTAIDIKIFYDYKALNIQSQKRTTIDIIPVNVADIYETIKTDAIFHPKVIYLRGEKGAYLITGSANLSISAWSSNRESISIKKLTTVDNANQVLSLFEELGVDISNEEQFVDTLNDVESNWEFVHTLMESQFNLFNELKKGELYVWSPYFSKESIKLFDAIKSEGFPEINIVPHVSEANKVNIQTSELDKIFASDDYNLCQPKRKDDHQSLHHAKVWLTPQTLAVGSWNCSFRATGLNMPKKQMNIEAGVIQDIDTKTFNSLKGDIVSLNGVEGVTVEELNKEWEEVLNPFCLSVEIMADWESFSYSMKSEIEKPENYTISLPHAPNDKISLNTVDTTSFRDKYIRVLKNKSFTVFDKNDKAVFQGFICEENKEQRQPYAYVNLSDLISSLIDNPSGEGSVKQCQYKLSTESDNDTTSKIMSEYKGTESYYFMFVSFQKLLDKIDESKKDKTALDKLGYRLPGSLLNIKNLVAESIELAVKEKKEDDLLFHFFLIEEVNRCIKRFNKYIKTNTLDVISFEMPKEITISRKDKKFIKLLKEELEYDAI